MTKLYRNIFASILVTLVYQSITANLYSQAYDNNGKIIVSVDVKGNKTVSKETVLSRIKTKEGDSFDQETANEDLKRLYATEYFTNVSLDVEDRDGGIAVTFIVDEKPIIEDIIFTGNNVFRDQKLKALMKSKKDEMLNLSLLATDISEIKALYVKKGYPLINVEYKVDVGSELNKARITIEIDEKSRVKVASVKITGNTAISTKKIIKVMGTRPAWLFNPGVFKEDVFQEDLEKIKALYDDEGFLDADVISKTDYSADGRSLYITIEVEEGRHYLVGDVTIKGNLILPEKDIRSRMALQPGKSFSSRMLRNDVMEIRQYYSNYGYMNAAIEVDRNLNPNTGRIDIAYNIDAKDLVYVGKVEIRGNVKTKEVVVRREVRIYPGDRFDGAKIRRSKERLYNLGLFEDIVFDTEETENPKFQDLIINVKETKTGEFSFGGGYSSIDYLVGFVEVTQKNFDIMNFPSFTGAGQRLVIKAEVGMVRQDYDIGWMDPWIFGYPYSFGFDLYQTSHRRRTDIGWAYNERRIGGDLKLGKELTDYLRGALGYRLEEVRLEGISDTASPDLKAEEGSNLISSMDLQLTQDTRDNIYTPTRGYVLGGTIADAGGIFGGDKDYVKGTGFAGWYYTFFGKFVLELSGRMGLENAYGKSDEVPIYERFFAGGANTIRGYRERSVGPRDPGSDDPIGGEAIVIGNAEITFPIFEKMIKGAVFYDIGNAWRRTEDFMVGGGYRYGAGAGVRIKTPIGPVKLDYGYPLVSNYDDPREGQFYFSMSHGF